MMLGNAFAAASKAKKSLQQGKPNCEKKKRRRSSLRRSSLKFPTIPEDKHVAADELKLSPRRSRSKQYAPNMLLLTPSSGTTSSSTPPSNFEYAPVVPKIDNHDDDVATVDAKSLFSVYVEQDAGNDNVSNLTEDFHNFSLHSRRGSNESEAANNSLITFRRKVEDEDGESCWRETTLQARITSPAVESEEEEELMLNLVKRLQEMTKSKASSVLRFPRKDRIAIQEGERRVVFVLPQMSHTKFSKEEFGSMTSKSMLGLISTRPLLVDIETEKTGGGEMLELF